MTISNQWVFLYTFSSGTLLGRGFFAEAAIVRFLFHLRSQGAKSELMMYLAAVTFTRLIHRFDAIYGIIMVDFAFFCRDGIEARKISLYSFV